MKTLVLIFLVRRLKLNASIQSKLPLLWRGERERLYRGAHQIESLLHSIRHCSDRMGPTALSWELFEFQNFTSRYKLIIFFLIPSFIYTYIFFGSVHCHSFHPIVLFFFLSGQVLFVLNYRTQRHSQYSFFFSTAMNSFYYMTWCIVLYCIVICIYVNVREPYMMIRMTILLAGLPCTSIIYIYFLIVDLHNEKYELSSTWVINCLKSYKRNSNLVVSQQSIHGIVTQKYLSHKEKWMTKSICSYI